MSQDLLRHAAHFQRLSISHPDPAQRISAGQEAGRLLSLLEQGGGIQAPQAHPTGAQAIAVPQSMVPPGQLHRPIVAAYVDPSIPPSRILTVPGIVAVGPATTSAQARLDFTAASGCDEGLIIGIKGCVVDSTAGVEQAGNYQYATMSVQMLFNDSENLVTDGESASFVPYCDLFSPGQRNMFPIYREVSSTDIMTFRWQNTQPLATGNTLTPSLTIMFLRKSDYKRG